MAGVYMEVADVADSIPGCRGCVQWEQNSDINADCCILPSRNLQLLAGTLGI